MMDFVSWGYDMPNIYIYGKIIIQSCSKPPKPEYIGYSYTIVIYIYISADPACSRGSASEEELPAARAKKSLQAARARSKKTRKKKQEARSNYRQQAARSKKQEARKQQAAGRQVRELVFLSIQKATLGRRLEDSSES